MTNQNWIGLSRHERTLLLDALKDFRRANNRKAREIDALMVKLNYSPPHPEITIGVHGGQVQLPDVDERGQRCRIWFEPRSDNHHI